MPGLEEFGDFGRHRACHHPRRQLKHIDLEPLGACGRGEFETDEARADHHHALARYEALPQGLAFVERAQVPAPLRDWHSGYRSAGCARRWPARGAHIHARRRTRIAIFRAARSIATARPSISSIFWSRVKLVGAKHQAVAAALALQIGLRQRRPLIWQVTFIIDQAEGPRHSRPAAAMPQAGSRHGRRRQ